MNKTVKYNLVIFALCLAGCTEHTPNKCNLQIGELALSVPNDNMLPNSVSWLPDFNSQNSQNVVVSISRLNIKVPATLSYYSDAELSKLKDHKLSESESLSNMSGKFKNFEIAKIPGQDIIKAYHKLSPSIFLIAQDKNGKKDVIASCYNRTEQGQTGGASCAIPIYLGNVSIEYDLDFKYLTYKAVIDSEIRRQITDWADNCAD